MPNASKNKSLRKCSWSTVFLPQRSIVSSIHIFVMLSSHLPGSIHCLLTSTYTYISLSLCCRDSSELFSLIKRVTDDTVSEQYLLSILQHFVLIREDSYARSVVVLSLEIEVWCMMLDARVLNVGLSIIGWLKSVSIRSFYIVMGWIPTLGLDGLKLTWSLWLVSGTENREWVDMWVVHEWMDAWMMDGLVDRSLLNEINGTVRML